MTILFLGKLPLLAECATHATRPIRRGITITRAAAIPTHGRGNVAGLQVPGSGPA